MFSTGDGRTGYETAGLLYKYSLHSGILTYLKARIIIAGVVQKFTSHYIWTHQHGTTASIALRWRKKKSVQQIWDSLYRSDLEWGRFRRINDTMMSFFGR